MAKQTFSTGQVLTSAQMTSLQANDYNWTVSAKTASYVLAAADAGTHITMNAAGATTVTVNTALFTAGDILRITSIGAGTCTITAGTATVTTAGSLALKQWASGLLYFTSASAAIFFPDGVNGKVVQVVSTTKTDTFSASVAAGAFAAITGLTAAITPTSTSSKILIVASVTAGSASAADGISAKITGGNSASYVGTLNGSRTQSASIAYATTIASTLNLSYLDSPASVAAQTYGVSITFSETGTSPITVYCNRGRNDTNAAYTMSTASTITVMEISA